jgi:hypothetical protein
MQFRRTIRCSKAVKMGLWTSAVLHGRISRLQPQGMGHAWTMQTLRKALFGIVIVFIVLFSLSKLQGVKPVMIYVEAGDVPWKMRCTVVGFFFMRSCRGAPRKVVARPCKDMLPYSHVEKT